MSGSGTRKLPDSGVRAGLSNQPGEPLVLVLQLLQYANLARLQVRYQDSRFF